MSDYDIQEALAAKEAGDADYFYQVLPRPTLSEGVVGGAPDPPSQREWAQEAYPDIPSGFVGQEARNVLIEPAFPLDVPWVDPNPETNDVAAFIGLAPDSSPAIEFRYEPGRVPQFVDAYIPLIAGGRRQVGIRFEVYTEAGFDFGPAFSGGKIAGGLWGGSRPATGLSPPWEQGGVTWRNVWGVGSALDINARGDGYILNRSSGEGAKTGIVANRWIPGQWQVLEYEAFINTPGFADGFCRMWLDGECIAEITNAIWALDDEWLWRGAIISDAWQHGTVNQSQRRWVRSIALYYPLIETGYGNDVDGYVELAEPAFALVEQTCLGIGVSTAVNSGTELIAFGNVGTIPTSLGFTGGLLYVQSGALYFRSAAGVAIQVAPA